MADASLRKQLLINVPKTVSIIVTCITFITSLTSTPYQNSANTKYYRLIIKKESFYYESTSGPISVYLVHLSGS